MATCPTIFVEIAHRLARWQRHLDYTFRLLGEPWILDVAQLYRGTRTAVFHNAAFTGCRDYLRRRIDNRVALHVRWCE